MSSEPQQPEQHAAPPDGASAAPDHSAQSSNAGSHGHGEKNQPPLADARGTVTHGDHSHNEWQELGGEARHHTVEVLRLIMILLQDSVILIAGFAVEYIAEHYLHSTQPFFRLAINISSAVFLLLYGVMVTVHVVNYVRQQFGTTAAGLFSQYIPWALGAAGVIAGVVLYNLSGSHDSVSPSGTGPVTRLAINLPPGQHLAGLDQPAIAISPDGKNLVYVATQDNQVGQASGLPSGGQAGGLSPLNTQQLYLRPLDSNEAKPIAGTQGAVAPFFSPDGEWIGFFADGKLKKVSVSGGAAVTLAGAPTPGGASWSSNGILTLQGATTQGLFQVPPQGGTPQPLTRLGPGENLHRWPEFLPDGEVLLFAGSPTSSSWNAALIAVQPASGGERKSLAQGTGPRYAASGHLLYAQAGTLMAVPFDTQRLEVKGEAVPAVEGVMQINLTGAAQYSASSTGTLAFLAGGVTGSQSHMVWVDRQGKEQLLPAPAHTYQFPSISPDGRRVAVGIADQEGQIWIYDHSRNTLTRLTFEGSLNVNPVWSSDGSRVAFRSNRVDPAILYWQSADGNGGAEPLPTNGYPLPSPSSFSSDRLSLAFIDNSPETSRDILVMNLKDHNISAFLKTPYEETAPKFSPDGKWLVYSSNESGRREIYVQPYPGPGGKWQISTDGGQEPLWNPKGGELFFRSGSKIMAVDVDTKSGFAAGTPHMLFDGPYLPTSASLPWYDVSPDGQRFLMLKPVESQATAPTQINIVLNWFEELKAKAPVK